MKTHLRTWIVVADSARARLFMPDEDETRLCPMELPGLSDIEVHRHGRDVESDRPGRSFASSGTGRRGALEPRHDLHKMEKHNYVVALAEAINRARLAKAFDRLVLVVPPRTLGEMRSQLSQPAQAQMHVIAKDLTKASESELWSEVAEIVRHRPLQPAR
jgi:protein required for attachment to host cells